MAIIEAFKTWCHHWKGYKYEVFVLTDHNILYLLMDTKNLSFYQVKWAYELFWYHFHNYYYPKMANKVAHMLFYIFQKKQAKNNMLTAENTLFCYKLQFCLPNPSVLELVSILSSSMLNLSLFKSNLIFLHQVFIRATYVFP